MKNIVLVFLFIIGNISFSQNINLSENEIPKMLCKTWKLDYGLIDGNKINGLEIVSDKYIFKADKTYRLVSSDSSFVCGTWKFNKNEKCIEMQSEKNSDTGKISFIDNTKIIIVKRLKDEIPNFPIENVEFYFKPD